MSVNPFSQDSGLHAGGGNENDDMYAPASYEPLGPSDYQESAAFGDADVLSAQNTSSTFDSTFGEESGSPHATSMHNGGDGAYGSPVAGRIGDNADDDAFSANVASAARAGASSSPAGGGGSDNRSHDRGRDFSLDERERKLDEREAELNRRVNDLEGKLKDRGPPSNWPLPPYIKWSYHDIGTEIPPQYRKLCRSMYTLWWMGIVLVWYNFILLTGGIVSGDDNSSILSMIFSLIYAFLTSMFTWTGWYRSIYYAFRDGKTRRWLFFFIWFGLWLAWMVLYFLGIPQTAHNGLIKMLDSFTAKNTSYGMAMLAHTILAALCLCGGTLMIIRLHKLYRSSGVHERAKQEAKRELVKGAVNHSDLVA